MKYSQAASLFSKLTNPTMEDSAVWIDALSSNKEHDRAIMAAEELLAEAPDDLIVQRCYCGTLVAAGMTRMADGYVKSKLNKNKKSSNANALAAYYMWIIGRTSGAGTFASKAIKADPNNTMAMEILAYCLIQKGKPQEAKIAAGAINEKDPGNPAVVRILDMCRTAER
jgi:tetratricopeptide (TPR) repeat protein